MKRLSLHFILWLSALLFGSAAHAAAPQAALGTVSVPPFNPSTFQLGSSLGRWYEVARLPASFEKGCVHVVSDYVWYEGHENDDHQIQINSACTLENGKVKHKSLYAAPLDLAHPTQWNLAPYHWMLSMFNGVVSYHILYMDPQGQTALLGSKEHNALWLLSRQEPISAQNKAILLTIARQLGFDLSELIWMKPYVQADR